MARAFDKIGNAVARIFAEFARLLRRREGIVKEITTVDELNDCLESTSERPVFIFKHSTRCPISARAKSCVAQFLDSKTDKNGGLPEFYLLKVVESRAASNALAEQLGVEHQSPQLILVDKGRSIWNTSHHNINAGNIEKAIQSAAA